MLVSTIRIRESISSIYFKNIYFKICHSFEIDLPDFCEQRYVAECVHFATQNVATLLFLLRELQRLDGHSDMPNVRA